MEWYENINRGIWCKCWNYDQHICCFDKIVNYSIGSTMPFESVENVYINAIPVDYELAEILEISI